MNCLAVHLNPRLCRLCHQLALHSGLCLSRLRRPLLQLAARLLYLVAQALLQSTPLFSTPVMAEPLLQSTASELPAEESSYDLVD